MNSYEYGVLAASPGMMEIVSVVRTKGELSRYTWASGGLSVGGYFPRLSIPVEQDLERFWKFVVVTEEGCWRWTGGLTKRGHGNFRVREESRVTPGRFIFRGSEAAHRWLYRTLLQPGLPSNHYILHSCEPRDCVRPSHLYDSNLGISGWKTKSI